MAPELGEFVRCAIYTRKSGDSGFDQEINSLDAQREVCRAYIKCNAHRGWIEVETQYDDGGYSGGSLDRPGLIRLMTDVDQGKIDVIVFYKIDRLTRSLSDFVRVMENAPVSFVSVTQAFDTSDTMGRLILNILLTFAQFEREMLTDRIRDKLRTMKQRGLFVNFMPPLGYDKIDGRLQVNAKEAAVVRNIYKRFETAKNANQLLEELRSEGVHTKRVVRNGKTFGGVLVNRGSFYKLLKNPLYVGLVSIDGVLTDGGHEPILDREMWQRAVDKHSQITAGRVLRDTNRYLLHGLLTDENGRRLVSDTSNDGPYRKRYYQTECREPRRGKMLRKVRVLAPQLESLVQAAITSFVSDPVRVRARLCETDDADIPGRSLTDGCATVAESFGNMKRAEWRALLESLLVLAEVRQTSILLRLSVSALLRFLRGETVLHELANSRRSERSGGSISIRVNANLVASHRDFSLSLQKVKGSRPDRKLVNLLERSFAARQKVMHDRGRTIEVIAREMKMTSSKLGRILRLTYLAPDIQAAIMDGRQPAGLTARKLTYSPMPLDWAEQRIFFGFCPLVVDASIPNQTR